MSDYKEKYLKYKLKYLELKNQIGGVILPLDIFSLGTTKRLNKEFKLLEELGYTIDLTELSLENKKIKLSEISNPLIY